MLENGRQRFVILFPLAPQNSIFFRAPLWLLLSYLFVHRYTCTLSLILFCMLCIWYMSPYTHISVFYTSPYSQFSPRWVWLLTVVVSQNVTGGTLATIMVNWEPPKRSIVPTYLLRPNQCTNFNLRWRTASSRTTQQRASALFDSVFSVLPGTLPVQLQVIVVLDVVLSSFICFRFVYLHFT